MAVYDIDNRPNTNGVYVGGGYDLVYPKATSAVTPGAVVVASATDGECQEAGAGAIHGVLGVAMENPSAADPAVGTAKDLRSDFAIGARVTVNRKQGHRFMGIIKASSAALVKGDLLMTAANGELEKYAAVSAGDSRKAVAKYVEDADFTPGGSAARKVCRLL